jgi:hypothetical protein
MMIALLPPPPPQNPSPSPPPPPPPTISYLMVTVTEYGFVSLSSEVTAFVQPWQPAASWDEHGDQPGSPASELPASTPDPES